LESTIVGIEDDEVTIYRLGGLEISEIERVVGQVKIKDHSSSNPAAPGQLASHYAPRKPFLLGYLRQLIADSSASSRDFAVLSFSDSFSEVDSSKQIALS